MARRLDPFFFFLPGRRWTPASGEQGAESCQVPPNRPSSTGGTVGTYSVAPDLPPGLVLNPYSGEISGVPTAIAPTAGYTVTGFNAAGHATVVLSITVVDAAPVGLVYSTMDATYVAGVAISPNTPSSGGGHVAVYSLTPPLPPGLVLDPATGVISGAPEAVSAPGRFTVTASNSGGSTSVSIGIEVVPPVAGFMSTGAMGRPRGFHTATLLPSGKVLVAGGIGGDAYLGSAELFDPVTGSFASTGSMAVGRFANTATLLSGGKVLFAGGYNNDQLASAELYDPAAGGFAATGSMLSRRNFQTATLLRDGAVFVAGGFRDASDGLATTELYVE